MSNTKIFPIEVLYLPSYDIEEKQIFENAFGKNNAVFQKYIVKGLIGGAFDVQFIVQIVSDPAVRQLMIGMVLLLIKELFDRNRKHNKEGRPRYTILVLKKERSHIVISNTNKDNSLTLSYSRSSDMETLIKDFSEEELRRFLEKDD